MTGGSPRSDVVFFSRCRFATKLPTDRLYTSSHYWLREIEPGIWQAGLTGYGIRLLGEIVGLDITAQAGSAVGSERAIGWVEGYKAVSDVFPVLSGTFAAANAELLDHAQLIERDPYGKGWLYQVAGAPDPSAMDARAYAHLLNETITAAIGPEDG